MDRSPKIARESRPHRIDLPPTGSQRGFTLPEAVTTVAIVGAGYWGKNLVRNFYDIPDTRLLVCDFSTEKLEKMKELYMSEILTSPEQFVALIRNAIDAFGNIVRAARIQPE